MIPIRNLFESHLTVTNLQRSMSFFGQTLGLELAEVFWERRVAFYWIGERGNSMLGLWEVGTGPQRLSLHIAFRADLPDLLHAAVRLRAANVVPFDFWGSRPTKTSLGGCVNASIWRASTTLGSRARFTRVQISTARTRHISGGATYSSQHIDCRTSPRTTSAGECMGTDSRSSFTQMSA